MGKAPESLAGLSLEWTGRHHSVTGDFPDLSTHTLSYDTDSTCRAWAGGQIVGHADYCYQRLDDQIGVVIYRPDIWQGQTNVVLNAIFNFSEMTDRAVITSGGRPLAVALGQIRHVPTPRQM